MRCARSQDTKLPRIADTNRVTLSGQGRPSTHRNNDFPFSASTFDVGQRLGNFRKWICFVDDDLQSSLFDQFGELSEVATAWMHKKKSIADPGASSSRSDTIADNPKRNGKSSAAAEVLDGSLRLWKGSYGNDPGCRLHDLEHLLQGFAADQVKACVKSAFCFGYCLDRIVDHLVAAERAPALRLASKRLSSHGRLAIWRSELQRCRPLRHRPK
jgi:hypothetical protein